MGLTLFLQRQVRGLHYPHVDNAEDQRDGVVKRRWNAPKPFGEGLTGDWLASEPEILSDRECLARVLGMGFAGVQ